MGFIWDVLWDLLFLQIWDAIEKRLPKRVQIGCWTVLALLVLGLIIWLLLS